MKRYTLLLTLMIIIATLSGCAPAPQSPVSQDPIVSQNIQMDDSWWQVTKVESGVGATHFFITVKNGKAGCVIDVTRTDEYILYDVGDLVRGDLVTTSSATGTFTFAETSHTYDTIGHLLFDKINSNEAIE